MITSFQLLTESDCEKLKVELEKFKFSDGKNSATGRAKEIKANFQLEATAAGTGYIFDEVKKIVMANSFVQQNILPCAFPRIFANYYRGGHHYDWHVDHAYINQIRTDFSFTIFLQNPELYEGGFLEMRLPDGEVQSFKLPEGHIVIYPTGQLHRVTEVTSGFRLSIVGWMKSAFSSSEDRQIWSEYVDLQTLLREEYDPSTEHINHMNQFRQKLLRRLVD